MAEAVQLSTSYSTTSDIRTLPETVARASVHRRSSLLHSIWDVCRGYPIDEPGAEPERVHVPSAVTQLSPVLMTSLIGERNGHLRIDVEIQDHGESEQDGSEAGQRAERDKRLLSYAPQSAHAHSSQSTLARLRVDHRVLNVLVPEVVLDQACIGLLFGEEEPPACRNICGWTLNLSPALPGWQTELAETLTGHRAAGRAIMLPSYPTLRLRAIAMAARLTPSTAKEEGSGVT